MTHTSTALPRLLLLAAAFAVSLAGCSAGGLIGKSTYGSAPGKVAEVSNIGSYGAGTALTEARGHFRTANFGYSAALYKRYVELSPNDPQGYVGLGASYDRLGRFDLADRAYAALYKLTGGTAQYYNNVGYSHMLRGELSVALTSFRKASRLDPKNLVIANNIQLLQDAANA